MNPLDTPAEESPSETPGDAELIAAVRGGDSDAFTTLHDRHHGAALRFARTLTAEPHDADQVVADAFARIQATLQQGHGPDLAFREYLHTTVRKTAQPAPAPSTTGGAEPAAPSGEADPPPEPGGAPTTGQPEPGVAARAFRTLPERWRVVLWHTVVEGESPAPVARILGLTSHGVTAMAHRARERLREAYLETHLADVPVTTECSAVASLLTAQTRGDAPTVEHGKLAEHLVACATCTTRYDEFGQLDTNLAAVLAPTVLGPTWEAYLGISPVPPTRRRLTAVVAVTGLAVTRIRHRVAGLGPRYTAIGAAAAAVIAVVALTAMLLPGDDAPRPTRTEPPAAGPEATPSDPPPTTPARSPGPSPSKASPDRAAPPPVEEPGDDASPSRTPRTPEPSGSSPEPDRGLPLPDLFRSPTSSSWLIMGPAGVLALLAPLGRDEA